MLPFSRFFFVSPWFRIITFLCLRFAVASSKFHVCILDNTPIPSHDFTLLSPGHLGFYFCNVFSSLHLHAIVLVHSNFRGSLFFSKIFFVLYGTTGRVDIWVFLLCHPEIFIETQVFNCRHLEHQFYCWIILALPGPYSDPLLQDFMSDLEVQVPSTFGKSLIQNLHFILSRR